MYRHNWIFDHQPPSYLPRFSQNFLTKKINFFFMCNTIPSFEPVHTSSSLACPVKNQWRFEQLETRLMQKQDLLGSVSRTVHGGLILVYDIAGNVKNAKIIFLLN